MPLDSGRNAGVTGHLDLPGQTAKFFGWVRAFTTDLSVEMLNAAGRGDSEWPEYRPMTSHGALVISGETRLDGFPIPSNYRGLQGTLTLTQHAGIKHIHTVRVEKSSFVKSEKEEGMWRFTHTCRDVAAPTLSGYGGTQPTSPAETFDDKELWAGIGKTKDPQGLIGEATQRFLVWGVSDDDAAEQTRLNQAISDASPPLSAMKLRPCKFTRLSWNAGFVDVSWGLTDTAEDVENPETLRVLDPEHLTSQATVAKINITPVAPGGDAFVLYDTSDRELNDAKRLNKSTFKLLNSREEREFPGTYLQDDAKKLEREAFQTNVFDFGSTPPAPIVPTGLVQRSSKIVRVNEIRSEITRKYAERDSQEDIEFPGTVNKDDTGDLDDASTITLVTNSSTPPAVPPAPLGELSYIESERKTHEGLWRHTFGYANTNSIHHVQFDGATVEDDPVDLNDEDTQILTNGSSTPPATPPPKIPDLKFLRRLSTRISSVPEQWKHVFKFARNNEQDTREQDGTITKTDINDFEDSATIRKVTSSATPPAAPPAPVGQLLETNTKQFNAVNGGYTGRWEHTFLYGATTRKQAVEFEGDIEDEATDLADTDTQTLTSTSSTAPATPTPRIVDLKFVWRRSRRLQGTPEKWRHQFRFERNNEQDKIELAGTTTESDIDDIDDSAKITKVTGSATPPVAPPAPVGFLIEVDTKQETAANGGYTGRWVHTFKYGPTSRLQNIEFKGDIDVDLSALSDTDVQTIVNDSDIAPTTPASRIANLQLRRRISSRFQGEPEQWTHRFEYGRNTNQDDIELKGTVTRNDVNDLDESAEITRVTGSATAPAPPAAPLGSLDEIESKQITKANGSYTGRWEHTFRYASTTKAEKVTNVGDIEIDPQSLVDADEITTFDGNSTPPADPVPRIAGLKITRRVTTRIGGTPPQWRHRFVYGRIDEKDKIEFGETEVEVSPLDVYVRRIATVQTCLATDTEATLGVTLLAANQTDLTFVRGLVKKINPTRFRQIIETTGENKKVHSESRHTALDDIRAMPTAGWEGAGFGIGSAICRVLAPGPFIAIGGYTHGFIRPLSRYRTKSTFLYRRRYVTLTPETYYFTGSERTVNAATFLGRAIHKVMYDGPCITHSYAITAAVHLLIVDHQFSMDSEYWMNDGEMPLGDCGVYNPGLQIPATGFYSVQGYFDPSAVMRWPSVTDFSVFTA